MGVAAPAFSSLYGSVALANKRSVECRSGGTHAFAPDLRLARMTVSGQEYALAPAPLCGRIAPKSDLPATALRLPCTTRCGRSCRFTTSAALPDFVNRPSRPSRQRQRLSGLGGYRAPPICAPMAGMPGSAAVGSHLPSVAPFVSLSDPSRSRPSTEPPPIPIPRPEPPPRPTGDPQRAAA